MRRLSATVLLILIAIPYGSALGCDLMVGGSDHEMHRAGSEVELSVDDGSTDCEMQMQCRMGSVFALPPLSEAGRSVIDNVSTGEQIDQSLDNLLHGPRVPPPQNV